MKKKFINLIILTILVITLSIGLTACNTNNNEDINKKLDEISNNMPNHYEIDLNMENYTKYIEYKQESGYYTTRGTLNYAYYENVTIIIDREFSSPEYTTNTYHEDVKIDLDASGFIKYSYVEYTMDEVKDLLNVEGYFYGYYDKGTIKSISGKIIFTA